MVPWRDTILLANADDRLSIYLAGWSGETEYRTYVKKTYGDSDEVAVFDPFDYHKPSDGKKAIVEDDKALIWHCDVLVAKVDQFSAGTMMEIQYAHSHNIPVFVITRSTTIKIDTWISYHATQIFVTLDDCFNYLRSNKEHLFRRAGTYIKKESDVTETNERYGMDDSKVATKLLDKNCSPMIVRKYTRLGFPLYIHLICDISLSDLDDVVHDCIDYARTEGILENDIQSLRNFTGLMSDTINAHYDSLKRGCVESIGVIYYVDKMMITSLQGDCMNHDSCRRELYECINIMTKI